MEVCRVFSEEQTSEQRPREMKKDKEKDTAQSEVHVKGLGWEGVQGGRGAGGGVMVKGPVGMVGNLGQRQEGASGSSHKCA